MATGIEVDFDFARRESRKVFSLPEVAPPCKQTLSFLDDAVRRGLEARSKRCGGGGRAGARLRKQQQQQQEEERKKREQDAIDRVVSPDSFGFVHSIILDDPVTDESQRQEQHHPSLGRSALRSFKAFGSGTFSKSSVGNKPHISPSSLQRATSGSCIRGKSFRIMPQRKTSPVDERRDFEAMMRHIPKKPTNFVARNRIREMDINLRDMAHDIAEETTASHSAYANSPLSLGRRRSSWAAAAVSSASRRKSSVFGGAESSRGGASSAVYETFVEKNARRKSFIVGVAEDRDPLELVSWSKHIPPSVWKNQTPKTKHLCEHAAQQDVELNLKVLARSGVAPTPPSAPPPPPLQALGRTRSALPRVRSVKF